MVSAYHSIVSFSGKNFVDFIDEIGLTRIFEELINKYSDDRPLLQCIIKYIALAYSKDSEKVLVDVDWLSNKEMIFEYAMLPPVDEVKKAVVHLEEYSVVQAVHKWLAIQDSDAFRQLQVLKDLKVEMQVSANSAIKKSSGEIDYDQKYKNAGYVSDLTSMIKALEAELMQNDPRFKEAVREVKSIKIKDTIGAEAFSI